MTAAEIKNRLHPGDMTVIEKLTRQRGLNEGNGFSYGYIKQVLSPSDPRTNKEIIAIAQEIIEWREMMAQKTLKNRKA